ncbi:MAG: glutamate-1-semialdehyde 2,1-aminomutase [Proteobacteria bacterium]|nr:glutamate-1-semialdehyde 2,1-aminomutase [Pseudomonadota bacterium]
MSAGDERSRALAARAQRVIPGGVNSPVRAFRSVGGEPLFLARAAGSQVWDVDGNRFVDYLGSWGPMLLGHGRPEILAAIHAAAADGVSFGASTEREVLFAELLTRIVPGLEKVRLVNSGTEACMSAVRVARGATGRDRIVKVAGGYHGHADGLLVRAGSGAETLGIPDSAGVPAGTARDTLVVPFNDLMAVEALFARHGASIAAMIVEPVAGNMGTVAPLPGYLEGLRRITTAHGALLIFDEVMCGFRVALGGAQQRYGVAADLVCLGKIIGAGLPVAAYGGRAALMDYVAPSGAVYQAGTLSGNPLGVAAGLALLTLLERSDPYEQLERYAAVLAAGLTAIAQERGLPLCVNRVGSMLTPFFCEGPVTDLASAQRSDVTRFSAFHRAMRARGVLLPPSQFEAAFVSAAHRDEDLRLTLEAAREAFAAAAGAGSSGN